MSSSGTSAPSAAEGMRWKMVWETEAGQEDEVPGTWSYKETDDIPTGGDVAPQVDHRLME